MTYEEVKTRCHVRSAIYRASNPDVKYANNHPNSFDQRVPERDKVATDWAEFDPQEHEGHAITA